MLGIHLMIPTVFSGISSSSSIFAKLAAGLQSWDLQHSDLLSGRHDMLSPIVSTDFSVTQGYCDGLLGQTICAACIRLRWWYPPRAKLLGR